jgi:TctA family transporter
MENALRQSMGMSQGSFRIFLERPVAIVFLTLAILVLVTTGLGLARSARKDAEA